MGIDMTTFARWELAWIFADAGCGRVKASMPPRERCGSSAEPASDVRLH
jgi:hypothetical protein